MPEGTPDGELSDDPTVLIPDDALRRAVGGQTQGAVINTEDLELAKTAAEAYVHRYKGQQTEWPADVRLGALRLAAGLYRDKARPGVVEAFSQENTHRRATDIQIEQLLRIGRFAEPQVG